MRGFDLEAGERGRKPRRPAAPDRRLRPHARAGPRRDRGRGGRLRLACPSPSGPRAARCSPSSRRATSSSRRSSTACSARPSTRSRWSRTCASAASRLHLLDLGGDISGNGMSKLFLTIAAAFAEAERDRIRERIGQVKADQKARGRYLGGIVPFGFRRGDERRARPARGRAGGDPRDGRAAGAGKAAEGDRRRCAGEGRQDQPRGRGGRPQGCGSAARRSSGRFPSGSPGSLTPSLPVRERGGRSSQRTPCRAR